MAGRVPTFPEIPSPDVSTLKLPSWGEVCMDRVSHHAEDSRCGNHWWLATSGAKNDRKTHQVQATCRWTLGVSHWAGPSVQNSYQVRSEEVRSKVCQGVNHGAMGTKTSEKMGNFSNRNGFGSYFFGGESQILVTFCMKLWNLETIQFQHVSKSCQSCLKT